MHNYNNTNKRKFQQLSLKERQLIQSWHLSNISITEIANRLGRNKSTISRQINNPKNLDWLRKRNGVVVKTYSASKANTNYITNKSHCGAKYKLFKDLNLVKYIENGILKEKLSPDVLIGRAKLLKLNFLVSITTNTIYNYIHRHQLKVKLMDLLQQVSRKKRKVNKNKENKRKLGRSIDERDESILLREEFGHWEGDTVVDKNQNSIFVLIERKTRQYLCFKLKRHTSNNVLSKIKYLKRLYGKNFNKVFKSITFDNGSEFYISDDLAKLKVEAYYTHPYTSCEKGSVENCNGILRRYIPKGTNIKQISIQQIASYSNQINNLPRKILNYRTSNECYEEELLKVI